MTIGTALGIYAEDYAPQTAAPERIGYAITALEPFWGHLPVSAIKGTTCRRYEADRKVSPSTVRRELGTLQAALNYCAREGHLLTAPLVWKPEAGEHKDRYLTRQEVAWMLRASRKIKINGRHLGRFILVSLYTGTRKAAALNLRLDQSTTQAGWIDTNAGILYRRPLGQRETKKRQPPAKLPLRLLGHVRRWKAAGADWAVQDYKGRRIADVQTSWASCAALAEKMAAKKNIDLRLQDTSPHVLRHTAATWLMQSGAQMWDAAGYLGMTVETLQRVYGHHHPDHQESAVAAMDSGVSASGESLRPGKSARN